MTNEILNKDNFLGSNPAVELLTPEAQSFDTVEIQSRHSAYEPLLAAYEAGSSRVRIAVINELIKTTEDEAIQIANNFSLKDPEPHVRASATFILKSLDKPEVTNALIDRLFDEDPRVRWAGLKALAGTTEKNALHAIISQGLPDPDPIIRETALESLLTSQATGRVLQGKNLQNIASQIEESLVRKTATS